MKKKLIVILGPTAAGKTKYSLALAEKLNTKIIIADSRQVYKHLDIATAKPLKEEQKKIKHHLIDIVAPDEEFNLLIYQQKAFESIRDIFKNHDCAILTGGTGLYIDAVCKAYDLPKHGSSTDTREKLLEEIKTRGLSGLYEKLQQKDPESAAKIHPNDRVRIIRALEVIELSNESISRCKTIIPHPLGCQIIKIGLSPDREKLYDRINVRVDFMIKEGLLEECRKLISLGYKDSIINKGIIGYNEIFAHIEGKLSLEEAVELLKKNTRNYAKRQMTWFRRDKEIHWIDLDKYTDDEAVIGEIIKKSNQD